jgi:hypothetical protein
MRIEMCIDVDPSDFAMLLMVARQESMPLDALIKKIIADYVSRRLSPATTQIKEEGEK